MSRLDVSVKTARPGLEIMSFWPSKSLKWLFFRHVVNKQYSLLSSLPPYCLPSCPHRVPVSLNITFPFIFHFLSMCFISTFFCFTIHTDSTSASSLISSTVETRQSYALWEICKSTQTSFFHDCQAWIHFGKYIFPEARTYQSLQIKEKQIFGSHKMCCFVLWQWCSHAWHPHNNIKPFFFLALCTLYICINVTACNHFLCHRRLI